MYSYNKKIYIENEIRRKCLNHADFNNDANQLDLEHLVAEDITKYIEKNDVLYFSEERIKDLVKCFLAEKQTIKLKQIQEKMSSISKGDKEKHTVELNSLKDIYTFNDTDLMKISCWLTQVKRTAYNLEIKSPAALVFYSPKKATGKSTFMTLIKKAVLSSYQDEPHLKNFALDDLFTRFRPLELIQDLVITIDEIGWMDKDITAQMKNLITETHEIQIEKKYKDPITARKLANFMITTNDEPADLFYSDAHERRLSVIEDFDKKLDMAYDELYAIICKVWETAPLEYMYDTNELMEINLNRERTNDEIFESLVALSSSFDGFARFYTMHKLFEAIRALGYDINKKRFISYLETTPLYFEKRKHGERNYRFYPTDLLKQDCENEIKNDQNAPR